MPKRKIYIKPKNRGTFTAYCNRSGYDGVTGNCINRGKRSNNPTTRRRATFAANARKWNK